MSRSNRIRLGKGHVAGLEATPSRRGLSQGRLVREHLGRGNGAAGRRPFMRLAGVVLASGNLARHKGFSIA